MCACACVFYIYFSSAGVGAEVGPSVAGQAAYLTWSILVKDPVSGNKVDGAGGMIPKVVLWLPHAYMYISLIYICASAHT